MTHREIYFEIVNPKNIKLIKKIIRDIGLIKYKKVDVLFDETNFPYIRVLEKYDSSHGTVYAARYVGAFVDISKLFPDYPELYYLPIIALPIDYDENTKQFIDEDLSIRHELIHLKDILDFIESDSEYLDNVYKYSITNIFDSKDLKKSMEFEICRLIKMETKALAFDFESGETHINVPFFWMVVTFQCESLSEYLRFKMYDYLSGLEKAYIEKFPQNKDEIKELHKKFISKYGKGVFGKVKTYDTYKSISKKYLDKTLSNLSR
jgi:hypothetical protein